LAAVLGLQPRISVSPNTLHPGETVTLSSSGSSVGNGRNIVFVQWSIVDGGGLVSSFNGDTNGVMATLIPATTGRFSVRLTVTDDQGMTASAETVLSVVPSLVVPDAPIIGTAISGDASANIAFSGPTNTGDSTINSYTATSSPGGLNANGIYSPITVTGLSNGVAYTFTVTARNSAGASAASAASNSVTPVAPVIISTYLAAGWNLLGNSINAPLDVTTVFADASRVATVWKWVPTASKWAFYAPALANAHTLISYAADKGYDVLATVNGGEGFWVNALLPFMVQLPSGNAIGASYFQLKLDSTQNKLVSGWNLIATGDNLTPSSFNQGLSSITSPVVGSIPLNVTTLWAWDSGLSNWYFYAPDLENSGGLTSYINAKGYLDFTANSKKLDPTTGFWINHP
jgi:hypothetical protein